MAQLFKITPKRPIDAGKLWKGIPHYDTIRALEEILMKHQRVTIDHLAVSNDKSEFVGVLRVNDSRLIGVHTSNARRHSMKLYYGISLGLQEYDDVIITHCIEVGRKRERIFNLENRLEKALVDLDRYEKELSKIVEFLGTELTVPEAKILVLRFAANKCVPWIRIKTLMGLIKMEDDSLPAIYLLTIMSRVIDMSAPMTQMARKYRAQEIVLSKIING